jgi:rubrerythrin
MSDLFNASEILKAAIRIEENGEVFYRKMADKLETQQIKDTFIYLADEDGKHKKIFEDMLSKEVDDYEPFESYTGEYIAYLRAYADEHIFSKEKTGLLMVKKIKTATEAIKFAIGIELDSIHYYGEAKNFVPEHQKKTIEKIIEEERSHYLKLLEVRKDSK